MCSQLCWLYKIKHGHRGLLPGKRLIRSPHIVCTRLVSCCSLDLDVGHESGALVNYSSTAVEMGWSGVE